jgi:hypothetical protein
MRLSHNGSNWRWRLRRCSPDRVVLRCHGFVWRLQEMDRVVNSSEHSQLLLTLIVPYLVSDKTWFELRHSGPSVRITTDRDAGTNDMIIRYDDQRFS